MMAHHAGNHILPLPKGVTATAIYGGKDDCYRYRLDWIWDASKPALLAVMMNPSTATHLNGDRTVAWVHRWADRNGFGHLIVCNSAAYRCTDQARLGEVDDCRGPDNLAHVLVAARRASLIVMGYGQPKVRAARGLGGRLAVELMRAGFDLHAWATAIDGTPRHPLYLKGNVVAELWGAARQGAPQAGIRILPP